MDSALDLESAPDRPLTREAVRSLVAKSVGRSTELTSEVAETILVHVAEGSFLTVAAGAAGVSEHSVYEWLRRGAADASQNLDTLFVRFANAYAQAKQLAEANAVSVLQRGGDGKYKDWRAQAWWLERRHKERWSLPKEGASTGITLALTNEQLGALGEALRVASAKPIEIEATASQVASEGSGVSDDKPR